MERMHFPVVHISRFLTNFLSKFIHKSGTYAIIDITFPAHVEIFRVLITMLFYICYDSSWASLSSLRSC